MAKTGKKLASVLLAILLFFSMSVCLVKTYSQSENVQVAYANDEDLEKQAKQIVDEVLDSVLKEATTEFSIDDLKEIFKTAFQGFSYINSTVTFLKLIGVVKDGTGAALARIQEQLNLITDRLIGIEAKLDTIISEMTEFKGETRFLARAETARDYRKYFSDFIRDYGTNGLNPLITQLESMRIDSMKKWYNAKTAEERTGDMLDNSQIVLVYDHTGSAEEENEKYELRYLTIDGLPEDSEDDSVVYIVLTQDLMPVRFAGDIPQWNIDTYHGALSSYFKDQIIDNANNQEKLPSKDFDFENEELLSKASSDAVNLLVYRTTAETVNESSTFAKTVLEKYGNYITYLLKSENGVDAMIKALFYTHTFEGDRETETDVAYQVVKLIESMVFETAYYSAFVRDVIGMSFDITMSEKEQFVTDYEKTVVALNETIDCSLTGNPNYCYITNTVLYYGVTQISAKGEIKAHRSGAQGGYDWYSAEDFTVSNWRYEGNGTKKNYAGSAMIGGDAATLISLTLRSNGIKADHKYWNEKLGYGKAPDNKAVLVSCSGPSDLSLDSTTPLTTEWVLGNYFPASPTTVSLRSLPSGCESEYVRHHRQVQGSLFDFSTSSLTSNTTVGAFAIYGESHWYWGVDEAAFMSGPSTGRVERNCYRTGTTDYSKTDTVDHYSVTFNYNTILQEPVSPKVFSVPGQLNTLYSFRTKNHYEEPQNYEADADLTPETFGLEDGFSTKVWRNLLIIVPCVLVAVGIGVGIFFIFRSLKRKKKNA